MLNWNYGSLKSESYLTTEITYDWPHLVIFQIREGLEGAVSIVHVLCKCSCTLNIDQFQEFAKSSLPDAIQSILHLLRLFQRRLLDLPKVVILHRDGYQ